MQTSVLALRVTVLIGPLGTLTPAQAPIAGPWPFRPSGPSSLDGRDDWNLGLLGAKAEDARRGDGGPGYQRRPVNHGPVGVDEGDPLALRITVLFPGGPADRAGLLAGDVVVGVNRTPFTGGILGPLAQALVAAEDRGCELILEVARGEARKDVVVTIPRGTSTAHPAGRDLAFDAALGFLAARQDADGGFPTSLGDRTGVLVQTSLAGLAWVAGGSDLRQGPHRREVTNALRFILRHLAEPDDGPEAPSGRGSWDQSNWAYGCAALFLAELQTRSPTGRGARELERIVAELARRQQTSGGWAHGPAGRNPLGYSELNIMTGLSLMALGAAKGAGVAIPKNTLELATGYIEASSTAEGGVGYSARPSHRGAGNIGRTASVWLGLLSLGLGGTDLAQALNGYVARHGGAIESGHASLAVQILFSGLAAQAGGERGSDAFFTHLARDLVLARTPTGALHPRPWEESLMVRSNTDVCLGEVWTTAVWAVVLGASPRGDRPGLGVVLGRRVGLP